MDAFKRIFKKVFRLPAVPVILIALTAALLTVYAFTSGSGGPLTYAAYLYSSYALIVGVYGLVRLLRLLRSKFIATPFGTRLTGDVFFRSELSLYRDVVINLVYVLIKLISGIRYHSVWFTVLAVYYLFLTVIRYSLLRYVRARPDAQAEKRRCRLCGILLMPMNLVLSGIVILIVYQNQGSEYPGFLIYAIAAYTFYAVISAGVSLVGYRKHRSPVLSATKGISLTAALVSTLSLETAMISQFGSEDHAFRFVMTGISGAVVCVLILIMASYMIIKPTKELRKA